MCGRILRTSQSPTERVSKILITKKATLSTLLLTLSGFSPTTSTGTTTGFNNIFLKDYEKRGILI